MCLRLGCLSVPPFYVTTANLLWADRSLRFLFLPTFWGALANGLFSDGRVPPSSCLFFRTPPCTDVSFGELVCPGPTPSSLLVSPVTGSWSPMLALFDVFDDIGRSPPPSFLSSLRWNCRVVTLIPLLFEGCSSQLLYPFDDALRPVAPYVVLFFLGVF